MALPYINQIISPTDVTAFKAGIDAARGVISSFIPVITGAEKKSLKGVKRERYEFLTESYTVAGNDSTLMTTAYNHADQKMSNNLLFAIDELQSYSDNLAKDISILREVVANQALAAGQQVLAATEAKSKSDSTYKAIWKALSLLFKKKGTKKVVPPTV
jgi:hypothetical protein